MPITMRQICTDAMQEINAVSQGETPAPADIQLTLRKLNELFDDWNGMRCAVYAARFDTFDLIPNQEVHTIGPTAADWTLSVRPVRIDSAQLVLTGNEPNPYQTINVRDAEWWADETTPTLISTLPTDVYYQPDWPNGKLYFWPVSNTEYPVQLQTRVLMGQVELSDTFTLPPGYRTAIILSLAERIEEPFAKPPSERRMKNAAKARALIFANNDQQPRIATADFGMQGPGGGRRADFYWPNGNVL